MFRLLVIAAVLASLVPYAYPADWSYSGAHGPDHWKDINANCGGQKQSPIDIRPARATYSSDLRPFSFDGYGPNIAKVTGSLYSITNNGHTAQVNVLNVTPTTNNMTLGGGSLPYPSYTLLQFHMHWGPDNCEGSEHTINDHHFPLEIHLVHINNKYASGGIGEAVNHEDGLAVLGIFADVGNVAHPTIDILTDYFSQIKYAGTSSVLPATANFNPTTLLPEHPEEYERYAGSLTTPNCYEAVTWTVFKNPIKISETQMNAFRALSVNARGYKYDEALEVNYRPTQPLNARTILKSYNTAGIKPENYETCGAQGFLGRPPASLLTACTFIAAAVLGWVKG